MSDLPARAPVVNAETAPFWEATGEGRLHLQRCDDCGLVVWYPRAHCPDCHTDALTWFDASGRGTVHSFTVTRRVPGRWSRHTPYVVAYVELEEGPRILTNVVGCDPDDVRIDMPVEVTFDDTGEGTAIPRFGPASAET